MPTQTPLAWKNLTHDLRRLAVAVSGVGFAVVLIFIELGFMNALLESTVQILVRLNGDLMIVNAARYAMPAREMMDLRVVAQARGVQGVKAAFPVYIETLGVLRERGRRGYPIRVIAFEPDDGVLNLGPDAKLATQLREPGTALTDRTNRSKYRIPKASEDLADFDAELSGEKIRLVGQFHLGIDFVNDGNLVMSPRSLATYFPRRAGGRDPLSMVDVGVVQVADDADVVDVQKQLQAVLGSNVRVMTKAEILKREMNFWRTSVPVGFIFLVGVYMGFVVGVIICYQIIYSDIADHMSEFATLKAMGYTNPYFLRMVLNQSLYLSVMGFLPGALLSYVCYQIISAVTGLTMHLSFATAALVLLVTMLMCVVSGLLAVRKLLSLDPAELF